MIFQYPACPIEDCVFTVPWLSDDRFKFTRMEDFELKTVLDSIRAITCTWNLYDFKNLYEKVDCQPLWYSRHTDLTNFYYTVDESLELIQWYLKFQMGTEEGVTDFLQNLYYVCERVKPKFNTIVVKSPMSAGKNWFWDMIFCFYWNKGQMGNPNKFNRFAYQCCVNRRIVLWNEPNYASEETEKLKMLLGGDTMTAQIKNQPDGHVARVPVIVLTNNDVNFMYDNNFAHRLKTYHWQACEPLKQYTKKPNPMAWPAILEMYNLL
uniref:Nonstructural protein n=1 Tax=Phylloscopus inornatus ambidensovirus TaxID=2794452 RepID=A0A8A4XDV6_9VIRU|nr:MAG: nonstructural protein [Phylloscopus inornatus ambidensovirus]